MDNPAEPTAAPVQAEPTGLLAKTFKVVTYPLAFVAGFLGANNQVTHHGHRVAGSNGLLDNLSAENVSERAANSRDLVSKLITKEQFLERDHTIKMKYRGTLDKRMAEAGLDKFFTKMNYVSRGSKQSAIIT